MESPELHMIEILSQPTSHKNFVILAFIGAELAGLANSAPLPPSSERNSGPHFRARVILEIALAACPSKKNLVWRRNIGILALLAPLLSKENA